MIALSNRKARLVEVWSVKIGDPCDGQRFPNNPLVSSHYAFATLGATRVHTRSKTAEKKRVGGCNSLYLKTVDRVTGGGTLEVVHLEMAMA